MRRIYLFVAFASMLAIIGCQKEIESNNSIDNSHIVSVVSNGIDTKTAIVEGESTSSFVWTGTTAEQCTIWENDVKGSDVNIAIADGGITATLSATFAPSIQPQTYSYHAAIASSVSNAGNPVLPSIQTPSATGFDPKADVLIGRTTEAVEDVPESVSMKFGRAVAVNKMILGGFKGTNEVVKEVVFTASNCLAGRLKPNYDNCSVTEYDIDNGVQNYSITLKYGDGISLTNGSFDVYFLTFPVSTGAFSVNVKTDQYQYVKRIETGNIDFSLDKFTYFNFSLSNAEAEPIVSAGTYNKVTADQTDWTGQYLIVYETSATAGLAWNGRDETFGTFDVSILNEKIAATSDFAAGVITVEAVADGYSLKTVEGTDDGQYISGLSSDKNGITYSKDPVANTITFKNGLVDIESNSKVFAFAGATDQRRFRFYKTATASGTGYYKPALYKYDDGKTPLSFGTENTDWTIDLNSAQTGIDIIWSPVEHAGSYTVSYTGGTPEDIETGEEIYEFNIEDLEPGTYEVSVTANPESNQYRAATISKSITVPNLNPVLIIEDFDIVADAKTTATEIPTTMENIDIVTFSGLFDDILCEHESSSTWLTITDTNNIIKYTSTANTLSDSRSVYVKIEYVGSDADETEGEVVFKVTQAGKSAASYTMITSAAQITGGVYVIGALKSTTATNDFYFANGEINSGDMTVVDTKVTIADNNGSRSIAAESLPSGVVEFTFTGDNTNGFSISANGNYLYFTAKSNRKLAFGSDKGSFLWKVSQKNSPLITGGVVLKYVKGSDSNQTGDYTISENSTAAGAIRGYANTTEYRAIYLFKKN